MEELNATVLSSALSCFHQKTSDKLKNQTSPKFPAQISLGDGLYIFGLIGVFIILKSLLTRNTMLENKADEREHITFQSKKEKISIAMVQEMENVVKRMESKTSTDVSHSQSCQTSSHCLSFVMLHEGKSSHPLYPHPCQEKPSKGDLADSLYIADSNFTKPLV